MSAAEVVDQDLARSEVGDFDLIVAAVGYEPRCTYLVEQLCKFWNISEGELGSKLLLLRFSGERELDTRMRADLVFEKFEPRQSIWVEKHSWREVREAVERNTTGRRVLIDYSCMSRFLYLSLVPLIGHGLELTFSYSVGMYTAGLEVRYPISAVGEVSTVPGLEGLPFAGWPRLYVFGLGYDGIGARALAHKLEVGRCAVFWAEPGASEAAASIATKANAKLIERADFAFCSDLRDVRGTVNILRRIAVESRGAEKVVFVPIGPKPHVLACGIVAVDEEHCTLLAPYVKGGIQQEFPRVGANGEVVTVCVRRRRQ